MVSDANNYNIKSYSVKALQQFRILKLKLKLLISHSQKCHLLFQLLQALNALHRAQIFDIISKPTTYRAHLKISIGTLLSFSIKWLSIFFIIKNWPTSRASFVYISLFKQTIQFFDNQCEKCHSHPVYGAGSQTHDLSNMSHLPLPLDHAPAQGFLCFIYINIHGPSN